MELNIFKISCLTLLASSMLCSIASKAADAVPMPSSGSCSFMINSPVPFGLDPRFLPYTTGGGGIGILTFTSSTTGTVVGAIVSPRYKSDGSPEIRAIDNEYINGTFTVVPMTSTNGFVGGYRMFFSVSILSSDNSVRVKPFEANVLPSNGGKTIMMLLANSSPTDEGVGPGTGLCQF